MRKSKRKRLTCIQSKSDTEQHGVKRDSEELGREKKGRVRKSYVEVSKSMSPFLFLSFRYSEF